MIKHAVSSFCKLNQSFKQYYAKQTELTKKQKTKQANKNKTITLKNGNGFKHIEYIDL